MVEPDRMGRDEYTRRWNAARNFAAFAAVRCAVVALALAATASYLETHDPVLLIVWSALGFGIGALGFAVYAFYCSDKGNYPSRLPHTWREYYREPPNHERKP